VVGVVRFYKIASQRKTYPPLPQIDHRAATQPSGHFPLLKHESVQSRCSETDADRTQAHPPRTAYPLSTRLDLLPFHPVYAYSAPGNNRQFLAANLRSPSLFYLQENFAYK